MGAEGHPVGDDPRWPATEDQAIAWLQQRGGAADQRLADRTTLASAVLAWQQVGLGFAVEKFLDALGDLKSVRAGMTNREQIGSYHCDSAPLKLRYLAREPLSRAAIVVALSAALAGAVAPASVLAWVQIALVAIGLACVGRQRAVPIAILVLSFAAAVAVRPATWWQCGYTLFAGWCLVHFVSLIWLTAGPWWTRGPLLGFVPWRTRVVLRLTGRATLLGVAVDLATSSRAAAAAPFVAACDSMPGIVKPVVEMCAALVAVDDGQVEAALSGAARAVDASRPGPRTLHGWCLAQLASILQQSGSTQAAAQRKAAMTLLTGRSCRRIYRELELSLMRYQLTSSWPRRDALARVHHHRLESLRRHDYDLLHLTEMWIVRLMLAEQNDAGAEFLLRLLVGGSDGRTAMHAQRDETPEQLLMRAGVQVARSPDPQEIPAIRRDVHVALAMLDAQRRPLASTAAHLLLAKLDHAAGHAETALANAGYSLVAAQHGRYMLPTPRWREAWDLMQIDAHATTLKYAAEGADSALVAEIIELARGEVLPAGEQVSMLTPLAGLDAYDDVRAGATASGPGRPLSDSASSLLAFQGLNPVREPPRVRIGPDLRLESLAPASEDIDLDAALQATAPRTWYWTGATVIDQYYWAVRSPDGEWSHGCASMAPGATAVTGAYQALGKALPFPLADEHDTEAISRRVSEGALGPSADHSRERGLLREVARAFLPVPLAEGLRSEPGSVRLVVSLSAALGHLPVAGLPLDERSDIRVVEKAAVVHVPSWSVATTARTRTNGQAGRWPARLAVFAPSGDRMELKALASPRGVDRVVAGPLSLTQLRNAVHAASADRDWLLTIIGHVEHRDNNPAESGLRLDGGYLTLADLVSADPAQRLTIPERVLLVGCGSFGFASPAGKRRLTPTSEWLGLSAAVVLAGAADVCCTLYTVYADRQMARIVDGLTDGLSRTASAPEALRRVQLSELNRWRTVGDNAPLQWLALAYVGTGWDR